MTLKPEQATAQAATSQPNGTTPPGQAIATALRRSWRGVPVSYTHLATLLGEVGEAAMLAFLYSISEGLEEYSVARTRHGLRALLSLVPQEATILGADNSQRLVALADLAVGDLSLIHI